MQVYRPILKQHRLQRLVLWALTALSWLADILFTSRPIELRRLRERCFNLAWFSRFVRSLLLARALNIVAHRSRRRISFWRYGRYWVPRHFKRSLIGAKLRRMLKHGDLATHIAQLIELLGDLDRYAGQLARRIRRLRRLWPITRRIFAHDRVRSMLPFAPAPADSS
jgi:hypothetical protein